ncbi:MAG: hypothetical protein ACJAZ9_001414 [Neolewinella sp.]
MAKSLNCRVEEIVNIDDETTYADPLFDAFDLDGEEGDILKRVLGILAEFEPPHEVYVSTPGKTKGYNLWVTYELRPN